MTVELSVSCVPGSKNLGTDKQFEVDVLYTVSGASVTGFVRLELIPTTGGLSIQTFYPKSGSMVFTPNTWKIRFIFVCQGAGFLGTCFNPSIFNTRAVVVKGSVPTGTVMADETCNSLLTLAGSPSGVSIDTLSII